MFPPQIPWIVRLLAGTELHRAYARAFEATEVAKRALERAEAQERAYLGAQAAYDTCRAQLEQARAELALRSAGPPRDAAIGDACHRSLEATPWPAEP